MTTSGNSPENFRPQNRLSRALFDDFFSGVVLGDCERLSWVSNQLNDSRCYLLETMRHDTEELVYDLHATGTFQPDTVQNALEAGIRTYEYSGLLFDPISVQMAVEMSHLDRTWLRQTVKPTRYILNNIVEVQSKHEYRVLHKRGLAAMGALGLTRRFGFKKRPTN